MKRLWLIARSTVLWLLSYAHFVLAVLCALVAGAILGERRVDRMIRFGARNIVFLAGARLRTTFQAELDRDRTRFLVSNHVNLFDPFVLYAAIPVRFRGLELESHFKIPVYGWLMARFGNVPVPDQRTPSGLKRTYRLTKEALEGGTNLLVFPEGGRTLDGRVDVFEGGVFRMARTLGYPITPISIVNAYAWKRKGSRLLRPATVEVVVHPTIDAEEVKRVPWREMRDRVREIVSGPVHEALRPPQ